MDTILPPPAMLMHLAAGKFVTQALAAAAELSVAEQLVDGPKTAQEIAGAMGLHAPSLYRLMRALVAMDVLAQNDGDRFTLTATGQLLRSDVPGSFRAMAILLGRRWHHTAWASLAHSVRTGESAFLKVYGVPHFEWLQANPEEGAIFNEAMTSLTAVAAEAVTQAYDFSGVAKIADIGGGHGLFLSKIMQANPRMSGILFDLPHVAEGARKLLGEAGLRARCEVLCGDFFTSIPAGCDAYVLKHVLHDWDDARCEMILSRCRDAMARGGRVLVVEMVVPPPGVPSFARLIDLEMLAISSNGKERTEAEFADLFAKAGLSLSRVVPTQSPYSVLEALRA
jgi:O-methyltransferase domain/Dimerisation domain